MIFLLMEFGKECLSNGDSNVGSLGVNDIQSHTGYSQVLSEVTVDDQGSEIKRIEYTIGHDQIAQTVYDTPNPGGTTHIFHAGGPVGIGRVAERQDDSHSASDCG